MTDEVEWFSLVEIGQRIGRLVWVEERLAELFEEWTRVESRYRFQILLAEASGHHQWHAETLRRCLPTSPTLAVEAEVVAPSESWTAAVDLLNTLTEPEQTSLRLQTLDREVYPWLDREVTALLDVCSDVSDRHLKRWLRFIALDHANHRSELAELLSSESASLTRMADHSVLARIGLRSKSV